MAAPEVNQGSEPLERRQQHAGPGPRWSALIATGAAELIAVESKFLDDDFFIGIFVAAVGCCGHVERFLLLS